MYEFPASLLLYKFKFVSHATVQSNSFKSVCMILWRTQLIKQASIKCPQWYMAHEWDTDVSIHRDMPGILGRVKLGESHASLLLSPKKASESR